MSDINVGDLVGTAGTMWLADVVAVQPFKLAYGQPMTGELITIRWCQTVPDMGIFEGVTAQFVNYDDRPATLIKIGE